MFFEELMEVIGVAPQKNTQSNKGPLQCLGLWPTASWGLGALADGSSSLHVPSAQPDADGTFVERMNDQAAFPPPSCLLLPAASAQ